MEVMILFLLLPLCFEESEGMHQGERKNVEVVYPERIHHTRSKKDLSTQLKEKQHEDTLTFRIKSRQEGDLVVDLKKDEPSPVKLLLRTYADGKPVHTYHDQANCFYSGSVKEKRNSHAFVSTCNGITGSLDTGTKRYEIEPHDKNGGHSFYNIDDELKTLAADMKARDIIAKRDKRGNESIYHDKDDAIEEEDEEEEEEAEKPVAHEDDGPLEMENMLLFRDQDEPLEDETGTTTTLPITIEAAGMSDGSCTIVSKRMCLIYSQNARAQAQPIASRDYEHSPPGCFVRKVGEVSQFFYNDRPSTVPCSKERICACKWVDIISIEASSVKDDNNDRYGPQLAWHHTSPGDAGFFQSKEEDNPWLQFQFKDYVKESFGKQRAFRFTSVTIINRKDCCGEELRNVEVRAGDSPGLGNKVVGYFKGPGKTGGEHLIQLNEEVVPLYMTFQIRGRGVLAINGLYKRNEAPVTVVRCNGPYTGCCTEATPCKIGQGVCANDQQCAGSLTCGTRNCHWENDDNCCQDGLYQSLGCWRDSTTNHAIPSLEGTDDRLDGSYQIRMNAVHKCYKVANERGFKYFAVQNGECVSGEKAGMRFNMYQRSTACVGGRGGPSANSVFVINGHWLMSTMRTTLTKGSQLTSANGKFTCKMQEDGNLVIYGPANQVLWSSRTSNVKIRDGLKFQTKFTSGKGNLEMYQIDGKSVWSSGNTRFDGAGPLLMQDDGNLVLYGVQGHVWSNNHVNYMGQSYTEVSSEIAERVKKVELIKNVEKVYIPYMTAEQLKHPKYVEMFVSVDNGVYEQKRNNDVIIERVLNYVAQVDKAYSAINIHVVVVAIEIQNDGPAFKRRQEPSGHFDLTHFNAHLNRIKEEDAFKNIRFDNAQLFSHYGWGNSVVGYARRGTICYGNSLAMNEWSQNYRLMVHELGHNLGFYHDYESPDRPCKCLAVGRKCFLDDWESSRPGFSDCNMKVLAARTYPCLNDHPMNPLTSKCGNGIREKGEECDCGTPEYCAENDQCCEPHGCRLKAEAQCNFLYNPDCCTETCQVKGPETMCREATHNCDVPEYCTGEHATCPSDRTVAEGTPCGESKSAILGLSGSGTVKRKLTPRITGRYFKIIPTNWARGVQIMACMKHLELFGCDTSQDQLGECTTPFGIGRLPDSALTYGPTLASRPNVNKGGWCSKSTSYGSWVQVDLGKVVEVSSVQIGSMMNQYYITSFFLMYSDNGNVWEYYKESDVDSKGLNSVCFGGKCTLTHDDQCRNLWGGNAKSASNECYNELNTNNNGYGTCDSTQVSPCAPSNVKCGQLQCTSPNNKPSYVDYGRDYTSLTVEGKKCSAAKLHNVHDEVGVGGMTHYGTKCADGKLCVDQECKTPQEHGLQSCGLVNGHVCGGRGRCMDNGKCLCNGGYNPDDNCATEIGTIDGGWGDWSDWSSCSTKCGSGTQRRHRFCNSPTPRNNGRDCVSSRKENRGCVGDQCPVDGQWTEWISWSPCSVSCGVGKQKRTRECSSGTCHSQPLRIRPCLQPSCGIQKWRDDGRCGFNFRLSNGKPSECDPKGETPCCSGSSCGNTSNHCDCAQCIDYRKPEITWRDDNQCGYWHPLPNGNPTECPGRCCSMVGWCGVGHAYCEGSHSLDYRKKDFPLPRPEEPETARCHDAKGAQWCKDFLKKNWYIYECKMNQMHENCRRTCKLCGFKYECLDGNYPLTYKYNPNGFFCNDRMREIEGSEKEVMSACDNDPQCTGYDYHHQSAFLCKQTSYLGYSGKSRGSKLCKKITTDELCPLIDTIFNTKNLNVGRHVGSWRECSKMCHVANECHAWSYATESYSVQELRKYCILKGANYADKKMVVKNIISGTKSCVEPTQTVHTCDKATNGGCAQMCNKNGDEFFCSCHAPDFKLGDDRTSCDEVHPCDKPDNGGCAHICTKIGDEAVCECRQNYFVLADDGKTCNKANCEDIRTGCSGLKRYCTYTYMKVNCKKTCGHCNTVVDASCKDFARSPCTKWVTNGWCDTNYVRARCCKSCH